MSSENLSTRNRILKSSQTLLETGGAAAVRMSDIAKSAGISRQALYLHFPNRAELLVATTRYLDEVHQIGALVDKQVVPQEGTARLAAFIEVWGNYIPKIYGVGKALMAMMETDAEARAAWEDRMSAVRGLCEGTITALEKAGVLSEALDYETAVDLLAMLVSVRNWEALTQGRGWTQEKYLAQVERAALQVLTG